MTEDDLRLLLHAHGWTLHYNRKRSGTYLEATRHRRPKTQTIHLGPLKNLALLTESDILKSLERVDASPRSEPE